MIVYDNVTFSNQRAGGVPSLCSNVMRRVINSGKYEYLCLEDENALNNIFRQPLDIPSDHIIRPSSLFGKYERYRDVKLDIHDNFIYQSSYFRICKNKNAKNLVLVYDFMYEMFETRKMALAIHKWQKYKAIRNASKIICISESTKRDLLKYLPETDPSIVEVVYIGVSTEYKPLASIKTDYSNYVLVVGGRLSYKNFDLTVDAISRTNYNLLICGSPLSAEEEKFLNSKIGKDRYKVIKHPSNEELNEIYNSVYCLAYPSAYEGFGIPVVEAQSAGCPVIAYNASSIPEIIGNTPLLMHTLTTDEFVSKLKLLENEGTRKDIITMGLENSRRFDWDTIAARYMAIYDEMMQGW